jgi:hypothetical protein
VGLLGAGALGYVLKDDPPETLVHAVRAVGRGRRWLSPRVMEVLLKSAARRETAPLDELTERETEVLRLMATGYRNERIAETLDIKEQTVKNPCSEGAGPRRRRAPPPALGPRSSTPRSVSRPTRGTQSSRSGWETQARSSSSNGLSTRAAVSSAREGRRRPDAGRPGA